MLVFTQLDSHCVMPRWEKFLLSWLNLGRNFFSSWWHKRRSRAFTSVWFCVCGERGWEFSKLNVFAAGRGLRWKNFRQLLWRMTWPADGRGWEVFSLSLNWILDQFVWMSISPSLNGGVKIETNIFIFTADCACYKLHKSTEILHHASRPSVCV